MIRSLGPSFPTTGIPSWHHDIYPMTTGFTVLDMEIYFNCPMAGAAEMSWMARVKKVRLSEWYPPWNKQQKHLKMDAWNTICFPFGALTGLFLGANCLRVSGSRGAQLSSKRWNTQVLITSHTWTSIFPKFISKACWKAQKLLKISIC